MKHQRRVAPGVLPENRVLGLGQAEPGSHMQCGTAGLAGALGVALQSAHQVHQAVGALSVSTRKRRD